MVSSGVTIVNELFDALAAGDIDRMVKVLTPDVAVHQAENLPYPGTFVGVDAYREDLLGKIQSMADVVLKDRHTVQVGDQVMVSMVGEFTSKFTGRAVSMPMIEVYSIKDSRISEIDVYYKDTAKMSVLFSER
ncbi:nuclear transport factor 2 family protein [Rhodococcus opacus]|uniref:nuclear transport factor 2 family protein n=1 Tax=Rhodococcus opacus TaxID=37919 RepID=UPI002474A1C4|nr:nuclear transport factor 2 family protein [Rhodococcus opacus]MDH6292845.1 ketosteroid isomerase-like protein [Rhodococcus opacus]